MLPCQKDFCVLENLCMTSTFVFGFFAFVLFYFAPECTTSVTSSCVKPVFSAIGELFLITQIHSSMKIMQSEPDGSTFRRPIQSRHMHVATIYKGSVPGVSAAALF